MNAQEHETAEKIVRVLDRGARDVGNDVTIRLAAARKLALAGYRETPQWIPAWAGQLATHFSGKTTTGVRYALPMTVLILGLMGIVYWQTGNGSGSELADLDAHLLTDELPIDAYLDKGFDSWLKRQSR